MLKQVQFRGRDESGNIFCQPLFMDGLEKTAAATERSNLHPKIKDFVKAIRPTKHGIYVLVNALGAGEYWGSNVNGDLFPEAALIHAPEDWEKLPVAKMQQVAKTWEYGYPTFMNAAPYRHHQNKDRSRAFGSVELAVWNPEMHRVELVVYLDRELCKKFGAYDVIERIENGEFPDVSMGCRVPYDVCTICEHKSKTRADYCEHAATMMNVILPDGRKVAVRNDSPRFFDISFVFIGADKTAKVMAKLAQKGEFICMGEFCTIPRPSAQIAEVFSKEASVEVTNNPIEEFLSYEKAASDCGCGCAGSGSCGLDKTSGAGLHSGTTEKRASHRKLSELTKAIPAGPFTKETLPRLERTERDLPKELLDEMGGKDLGSALSTASLMGMVLKPEEFQRVLLIRIGEKDLADKLDSEKKVFAPTDEVDESIPIEKGLMDEGLKKLLMGLMGERSIAAPALRRRVVRITIVSTPRDHEDHEPVMKKIAAAYNGYRSNLIKKATQIRENLVTDSQLRSSLYDRSMVEAFAGGVRKTASADVFSPESFAYLVRAYQNPDVPVSKETMASLAQMGAFVGAAA